ncbi:MAG: hypothetical protein U0797_15465 [Gemmataceae bacterium]
MVGKLAGPRRLTRPTADPVTVEVEVTQAAAPAAAETFVSVQVVRAPGTPEEKVETRRPAAEGGRSGPHRVAPGRAEGDGPRRRS